MRQGRFQDAVRRYHDVVSDLPTDLWVQLGHASALECAGRIHEAEQLLEDPPVAIGRRPTCSASANVFCSPRRSCCRHAPACMLDAISDVDGEPLDQLADLYFNQGRYHEALNELRRILDEEPLDDDELKASVLASYRCMPTPRRPGRGGPHTSVQSHRA